jgi:hypothetical protein
MLKKPKPFKTNMTVSFETITPEYAEYILANKNVINRKLVGRRAERLNQKIKKGTFKVCGLDCIGFTEDGDLMNGQHRLKAIVLSGEPMGMTVMRNVPKDYIYSLDGGSKRSISDNLAINGVMNPKHARLLTSMIVFNNEILHKRYGTAGKGGGDIRYKLEEEDVEDIYLESKEKFDIIVEKVNELPQYRKLLPKNQLAAWLYMLSYQNPHTRTEYNYENQAFDFLRKLMDGKDINEDGNPIYILREKLLRTDYPKSSIEPMVLLIKAMNAYYTNTPIYKLSFKAKEAIPTVSWGVGDCKIVLNTPDKSKKQQKLAVV